MKIQTFLEHHGIAANPFTEEDAQTDPVFKGHCIASTYHPTWDKVYGDPGEPATSIVFGEKGAGKTAMRLQIVRHLEEYNAAHPAGRVYTIEYDDFNPFLDRFRDRLSPRHRRPDRTLQQWKLWDHMDSILSLGVTRLVDRFLAGDEGAPRGGQVQQTASDTQQVARTTTGDGDASAQSDERGLKSTLQADRGGDGRYGTHTPPNGHALAARLDRLAQRDLLLLAACYDQSPSETFQQRWRRLRRKLRFRTWRTKWPHAVGIGTAIAVFALIAGLGTWSWLKSPWPYLFLVAGWVPWAAKAWRWTWRAWGVTRHLRVVDREVNPLRQVLMNFAPSEIAGQPLPNKDRTDDRYELLAKLQNVLKALGYAGIVVLVDRADEPHLINGSAERMRDFLWPMLDNKFLKHPGVGFKLLLPIELSHFIDREDREFYQRARLDKQNMIPSLEWTGEALYDVANSRIRACARDGAAPTLRTLFEEAVSERRLIDALRRLRVPRHLFKFMYRLLVAHSNAFTDESPQWTISAQTFESVLALYSRDQDALDRGLGAG